GFQVVLVSDHGFVYGAERARTRAARDPLTDLLHSPEGIYVLAGEAFTRGAGPTLDLYDVAPTVLETLGIPPARDMAGTPSRGILEPAPLSPVPSYDGEGRLSRLPLLEGEPCGPEPATDDTTEQVDKLRALGYL